MSSVRVRLSTLQKEKPFFGKAFFVFSFVIPIFFYSASNANDKTFANPTTGYFTSPRPPQGYALFDSTTGTLTFKYGTPTGTPNVD